MQDLPLHQFRLRHVETRRTQGGLGYGGRGEIDQDVGHYERFLDINIPRSHHPVVRPPARTERDPEEVRIWGTMRLGGQVVKIK